MAGIHSPPRDEGDLHRLVDGLLDSRRLGEVLLRVKAHAGEAARVAAWREQNDLLKTAFAGVEQDPIPASLRLTPLRLRCIGDDERPADLPALAGPASLRHAWPDQAPQERRDRTLAAVACCTLAAAALAASWLTLARPVPSVKTVSVEDAGDLAAVPVVEGADLAEAPRLPDLPTATIPDLGSLGFAFTGAAVRTMPQRVLVFSYRNDAAARLTLTVSRPRGTAPATPAGAIAWQRDGRLFLLGGTLEPERMALVASVLQAAEPAP